MTPHRQGFPQTPDKLQLIPSARPLQTASVAHVGSGFTANSFTLQHTNVFTQTCTAGRTHAQYDPFLRGHWRPGKKSTPSNTSTHTLTCRAHWAESGLYSVDLNLFPSSCQIYLQRSLVRASVLTSALIVLCLYALQFKLTLKCRSDMMCVFSSTTPVCSCVWILLIHHICFVFCFLVSLLTLVSLK